MRGPALPHPCSSLRTPHCHSHLGLSLSSSAALGVQEPWAGPAGGLQLSGGSTLPGTPAVFLEPPGPAPGVVLKSNHSACPTRALAQPAAQLASSPLVPVPDPQARRPSPPPLGAQIRSPASCPLQPRAPLACCPDACGAISLGRSSCRTHATATRLVKSLVGDTQSLSPGKGPETAPPKTRSPCTGALERRRAWP